MQGFIWLFAMLVIILICSRLASKWLWEVLGSTIYTILFWPGVLVHELSHAVGALVTFTPIQRITFIPRDEGNARIFGEVIYNRTRNPLKLIIISALPFLGGAFVLKLLHPHLSYDISIVNAIWIYLTVAIAIHLAPSNHDIKYLFLGIVLLAIIIFLGIFALHFLKIQMRSSISILREVNSFLFPIFSYATKVLLMITVISGFLLFIKRRRFLSNG